MKNDQVQTLNYCAHAIEDLRETAAMLQQMTPNSVHVMFRLIGMLQNSVKFTLPNCRPVLCCGGLATASENRRSILHAYVLSEG